MAQAFNCGIGAVLVVQKELAEQVLMDIQRYEEAWVIGNIVSVCTGYWASYLEIRVRGGRISLVRF